MIVATHPEECRSAPSTNWPIFDLCLPEYKERDDNDNVIVDYDDDGDNQWLSIMVIIMMMIFIDPYFIFVCLRTKKNMRKFMMMIMIYDGVDNLHLPHINNYSDQ